MEESLNIRDRTYTEIRVPVHRMNQDKLRDYQLKLEYSSLKAYAPLGVYMLPQLNNIRVWHGVIFIRQGDYKNGVFKFRIEIPEDYPESRPSVFFSSHVFHPLVDPETGEFNLAPHFPAWRPRKDFIFLILGYMKRVFYFKDTWTMAQHVLNPTALHLYTQDERAFHEEVRRCVMASEMENTDSNPNSPIRFTQFNAFHQKMLDALKLKDTNISEQEKCDNFMHWFRKNFM
jgi:ubiquitin-protein ligase